MAETERAMIRNTSWFIFKQAMLDLWAPVVVEQLAECSGYDEIHARFTDREYMMLVNRISGYWDATWAIRNDGPSVHFPILR